MISNTLDFKGVAVRLDGNLIRATPLFNCHFCGAVNPVERSFSVNINKDIDVNTRVLFTLPCCSNQADLFVAVYKPKSLSNLRICVQRTDAEGAGGIPANWWERDLP